MRRVVDLAVAIPALVLAAPAMLVLMAAIRVESPGPAVFRQTRVGRDGAPFTMLKLRTMYQPSLLSQVTVLGGRADPRVTRLGAVLRRTHLDELPQLVNVIRGDMTLIGPRPEIPEFVASYTPAQRAVLRVRPGITGPGQVTYATRWEPQLDTAADPNDLYLKEIMGPKLELELAYLRHRSLAADLGIVAETLTALVRALVPR
jgi:lipopolysaccharide/colanic/teichoic acid biosynthesis glycosyltransferase